MTDCKRCNKPGAGSLYKGSLYHLTCKLEEKLDDGTLGPTPIAKGPREQKNLPKVRKSTTRTKPAAKAA
jgi:hypothetical protein